MSTYIERNTASILRRQQERKYDAIVNTLNKTKRRVNISLIFSILIFLVSLIAPICMYMNAFGNINYENIFQVCFGIEAIIFVISIILIACMPSRYPLTQRYGKEIVPYIDPEYTIRDRRRSLAMGLTTAAMIISCIVVICIFFGIV